VRWTPGPVVRLAPITKPAGGCHPVTQATSSDTSHQAQLLRPAVTHLACKYPSMCFVLDCK
jgi:hypothetical protein